MRQYKYTLGFALDGVPLPNPSGFAFADSSLDTSAERDLTGTLHRNYVAAKYNMDLEYANIEWSVIQQIMQLVGKPEFKFSFPNPAKGGISTARCYAGDRKCEVVWMPTDGEYIGTLKFSVIEY